MQQFPCIQLNTQPPSVENSPTQQGVALLLSTSASDDLVEDEDDMATTSCAAHQLCCNPNSDTDNYRFCMNCNGEAHTICTEQINFQTPLSDKLVIGMWPGAYWLKLSLLDDSLTDIVYGGGGGGGGEGGGGRELCAVWCDLALSLAGCVLVRTLYLVMRARNYLANIYVTNYGCISTTKCILAR